MVIYWLDRGFINLGIKNRIEEGSLKIMMTNINIFYILDSKYLPQMR
jgi:hypothetical protein